MSDGAFFTVGRNESIQEAINAAGQGDIIEVDGGVHKESLIVNKSVILLGAGMPQIDGRDNESAVSLFAEGVILKGFIINCSNRSLDQQQGIKIASNNNKVINNTLKNCIYGIALINSSSNNVDGNNIVEGNTIHDNNAGIFVSGGRFNRIINDKSTGNNYGIYIQKSSNIIVEGCNFSQDGNGILLDTADDNNIVNNIVSHSEENGIGIMQSDNNTLIANEISYNEWDGLYIENSNNNTINGGNISYNKENGMDISGGYGNEIMGLSVTDNSDDGIYLYGSLGNIIIKNSVRDNQKRGIYIYRTSQSIILENNAVNNSDSGIELSGGEYNNIIGNSASYNIAGISIINTAGGIIRGNQAGYNRNIGISLDSSAKGTIVENTARNNRIGALLYSSKDNTIEKNNFSENELIGLSIESSLNNTIANNAASRNLGGIILLNSVNNSLKENRADDGSTGIALQDSRGNQILSNNADQNRIGIYLNRSNSSQIRENRLENNSVGLAVNLSNIDLIKDNYVNSSKYDLLRNENETTSQYRIWNDLVVEEEIERYLRSYKDIEVLIAGTESAFVHPVQPDRSASSARPASSTSSARQSEDTSPVLKVNIDSDPRGAEIWIDGKPTRAVTPSERSLSGKGYHDIELFLSGYEPLKVNQYISSSMAIKLDLKPLQSLTTERTEASISSDLYITFSSIPEGASIWVDKKNTGKSTPDRIYFDRPGNHTYDLFLSGYEIHQGKINITRPENISVTLIPMESEPASRADSDQGRPAVPGFLSWHLLIASLIYYVLVKFMRRSA